MFRNTYLISITQSVFLFHDHVQQIYACIFRAILYKIEEIGARGIAAFSTCLF